MKYVTMSDAEILHELGERIQLARLSRNLTQAHLADQAGIGRRTLQKAEEGEGTTLATLIAILRGLGLLSQLDSFLPEQPVSPVQLAKLKGHKRQRASQRSKENNSLGTWQWGE